MFEYINKISITKEKVNVRSLLFVSIHLFLYSQLQRLYFNEKDLYYAWGGHYFLVFMKNMLILKDVKQICYKSTHYYF